MVIANLISFIILSIGGLNWGLVGIFKWNLVTAIFGNFVVGTIIVYVLVLLATIWLIIAAILERGRITLFPFTNKNK